MRSRLEISGKFSQLEVSTREVPVLCSTLFNTYINHLKERVNNRVTKFGNNIKLCRTVRLKGDNREF